MRGTFIMPKLHNASKQYSDMAKVETNDTKTVHVVNDSFHHFMLNSLVVIFSIIYTFKEIL